ncbi:Ser/Thr protein kinase-like protein [Vulcanisaeta moutnovskia 768-28]|uniref:non-specific serine/threonine protein kinase n=1 Tax=Vulcanisaeta moutnovskia (strain 768-28) TaxID=985053 RepID=F0QVE9_VULM7|nr:RIO1 family regulatory kinase/ATPase [Vulcanisaeta moutnovskia]ADY02051.1 Ser/Thr protein kinase-like protein [Vulcanisaeta moutnovskia 768-28]
MSNYETFIKICERINCPRSYVGSVLSELSRLGVTEILSDGTVEFMGFRLLGKGQNSLVFKCRVGNDYYACKIRRFDSSRPNLLNEGNYLRLANSIGVGPRLIGYASNVLIMELINGAPIQKYVIIADPMELKEVLKDLLWQCRRLDSIGLAHNELSRPQDHIVISGGKAFIIDFESASLNSRVSNVAQLLNALIMGRGFVQDRIRSVTGISINFYELRETIRRYKSTRSDADFIQLLRLLSLK